MHAAVNATRRSLTWQATLSRVRSARLARGRKQSRSGGCEAAPSTLSTCPPPALQHLPKHSLDVGGEARDTSKNTMITAARTYMVRPLGRAMTSDAIHHIHPHFTFLPKFFDLREQRVLLRASLEKLNSMEPRAHKRRRKEVQSTSANQLMEDGLENVFLPDDYYQFEDVRVVLNIQSHAQI